MLGMVENQVEMVPIEEIAIDYAFALKISEKI
jgi:hypothetical protein